MIFSQEKFQFPILMQILTILLSEARTKTMHPLSTNNFAFNHIYEQKPHSYEASLTLNLLPLSPPQIFLSSFGIFNFQIFFVNQLWRGNQLLMKVFRWYVAPHQSRLQVKYKHDVSFPKQLAFHHSMNKPTAN